MKVPLKGFTQNIMQRNRDRNLKKKKAEESPNNKSFRGEKWRN